MSTTEPPHPGAELGLPDAGPGSLATWGRRFAALVADWAACMAVAALLFGRGDGPGLGSAMVLVLYVVQKAVLTALLGGSFGQLLARAGVVRLGGEPIGWWRSVVRAVAHALVIPAVVVGANRRGLDDILLETVVVNRV